MLEVMIAIALVAMASALVGWKMQEAVKRKKFQSEIERLHVRLAVCQRLATAAQSDWRGTLKPQKEGWLFEMNCEEEGKKKLAPLKLHRMDIFLDGKKVDQLTIDFFSSGHVSPEGKLLFSQGAERFELDLQFTSNLI